MTNYFIQNAIVGTEASKPDPANPTGNAEPPNYPLFIAGDTGRIYQSTGAGWIHIDNLVGTSLPGSSGTFTHNGVPGSGALGTFAGTAPAGSVLIDTSATPPAIYSNTGTLGSPTWTLATGASVIQIGYSAQLSAARIADATLLTATGLTVTCTPPSNQDYCVECYAPAIEEDSGVAAGDIITCYLMADGSAVQQADIIQADGGIGGFLSMKSATLTGDGQPHTFSLSVKNTTTGTNGVIVDAVAGRPMLIRVLAL